MTSRFLPKKLEARCLGGLQRKSGFWGETRHSLLDMFQCEVPTVHSGRGIKESNGHTALDFTGEVQAGDTGSV